MGKSFKPGKQDLLAIEPVGLSMMSAWTAAFLGPALMHPSITETIEKTLPGDLSFLSIQINVLLALGVSAFGMHKMRKTWVEDVLYKQYFESPVRLRNEKEVPVKDIKSGSW